MSQIRADNITNRQGTGAPIFVNGIRVTGLTSISNMVANTGTFSGAVSIGGTLTYEDVTNVDSLGVITARSGIVATGVVTATSFSGSGANLTGITQTTINNNADNRLISGSGTANTLEAEATLTYDGSSTVELQPSTATPAIFIGDSNRTGAGQHLAEYRGNWNGTNVARMVIQSGDDTTNKDDGYITFRTATAGSTAERLRIGSAGQIGIAGANYGTSGQVLTSQGSGSAVQWASVSAVQVSDGWWNGSDVQNASWGHHIWGNHYGSAPTRRTGFPSVSGQQMSLSGGNWTFPSAGLWKVEWHLQLQSGANSSGDFYVIESTNSGSSWSSSGDDISGWNSHFCGNYSSDVSVATLHATVNFSNATTYRLQCLLSTNGNAIVRKGTMILFTKLN